MKILKNCESISIRKVFIHLNSNLFILNSRRKKLRYFNGDKFFHTLFNIFNEQSKFRNQSLAYITMRMRLDLYFPESVDENFRITIHSIAKLLDDDYRTLYIGWKINTEKYFLFEPMEKFILESHQHGIIEYFVRKYQPQQIDLTEDPRRVLTMDMLSAGWYLFLGGICVSSIAFLGEHIVRYFSKRRRDYRRKMRQEAKWNLTLFEN